MKMWAKVMVLTCVMDMVALLVQLAAGTHVTQSPGEQAWGIAWDAGMVVWFAVAYATQDR